MTSSSMPSVTHARRGLALASIAGIGINRPPAEAPLARRLGGAALTGVVDRVQAQNGVTTASLAAGAARAALQASKVAPSSVDMIIVATTTPDVLWPSTACLVQTDLQLPMVAAFDLYGAQAGMLTALHVARHYVAAGLKNVLLIGAECERQLVDLPGQGGQVHARAASAIVLTPADGAGGLLATVSGGAGRSTTELDGNDLLMEGLGGAARDCLKRAQRSIETVDLVIADQSSPELMQAWAKREGVARNKLLLDPGRYGALLAAGPFIVLHDAAMEERLKDGMTVLMLETGSGPVWAAACLQWGAPGVGQW